MITFLTHIAWLISDHHVQIMMTSSNGNIFRVTGPLCGEFTGPGEFPTQRPVTRTFDVFFDLRLNKRLSKQAWGWWFETLSWSLWRHCNVINVRHVSRIRHLLTLLDGTSNHLQLNCLFNIVLTNIKENTKTRITGVCVLASRIKTQ